MTLEEKVNSLSQSDRESIAKMLHMANTMPGLTEQERQRERELIASVVSRRCCDLNIKVIAEKNTNDRDDAVDNFMVSK